MRLVILSFILSSLLISKFCVAQNDYQYLPDYKGNWKTNVIVQERFSPYKLTAEEKKILLQKAETATQLIKIFPSFNPPRGMEMTAITEMRYLMDYEKVKLKPTTPLPLQLTISMGDYISYKGKTMVFPDKETYAHITLFYNNTEAVFNGYSLFSEKLYDQQGNQYYFEPTVYKTFNNATIYNNNEMIFIQPGKNLWVPVTAKQYLETLLYHYSKLIEEGHSDNQMVLDNIKEEYKNLQAEDQNKPAYWNTQFGTNLSNLAFEKTANTTAIVRFNPDYFDKSKPRTSIQLLVVEVGFHSYDFGEPILKIDSRNSNNQVQLYSFFSQFDFSKFKALLD